MKRTFLSLLACVAGVLPGRAQDSASVDKFPVLGASYDVVCTDEARHTTTFTYGRIKIIAVGENGWYRIEYDAFLPMTPDKTTRKQAWINFAYLSSAVEANDTK